MRLLLGLRILFIGLILTFAVQAQNSRAKSIIIGSWKFDKFELSGDVSSEDRKEIEKAGKMNEGTVITFTETGQYKTVTKKDDKTTLLASGKYEILENGKFLSLDGQKSTIIFIDNNQIKFASPKRPIMVWAKIKP